MGQDFSRPFSARSSFPRANSGPTAGWQRDGAWSYAQHRCRKPAIQGSSGYYLFRCYKPLRSLTGCCGLCVSGRKAFTTAFSAR